MSGTKITLTGADEAHYLSASKETSRLIRFPDGISRHITLTNWHWEVLDRVHKNGWARHEIPKLVYEHATEFATNSIDFEEQIRDSFKRILKAAMPDVMTEEKWNISNERFPINKDDL